MAVVKGFSVCPPPAAAGEVFAGGPGAPISTRRGMNSRGEGLIPPTCPRCITRVARQPAARLTLSQLAIRIADGKVPDENSYWDTKPHSLIQRSCPWWCRAGSDPTMASNAHACRFKLANDGHDTRALQHYLGPVRPVLGNGSMNV